MADIYARLGSSAGSGAGTAANPARTIAEISTADADGDTVYVAADSEYTMDAAWVTASTATSFARMIGVADFDSSGNVTLPKDETEFPILNGATTNRQLGGVGAITQNLYLKSATTGSAYGFDLDADRSMLINCVIEYSGTYRAVQLQDAWMVGCHVKITSTPVAYTVNFNGGTTSYGAIGCLFEFTESAPATHTRLINFEASAGTGGLVLLDCVAKIEGVNGRLIELDGLDASTVPSIINRCSLVGGYTGILCVDHPALTDPSPLIVSNCCFDGQSAIPITDTDTVPSTVVTYNNVYGMSTAIRDAGTQVTGLQEWQTARIPFQHLGATLEGGTDLRVPNFRGPAVTNPFVNIEALQHVTAPNRIVGAHQDYIDESDRAN